VYANAALASAYEVVEDDVPLESRERLTRRSCPVGQPFCQSIYHELD
jgi:hypothetical protein